MDLIEVIQDKSYTFSDVLENRGQVNGQVTVGVAGNFNVVININNDELDFHAHYDYSLSDIGYVYIQYDVTEEYLEEFLAYAENLVKDLKEQLL